MSADYFFHEQKGEGKKKHKRTALDKTVRYQHQAFFFENLSRANHAQTEVSKYRICMKYSIPDSVWTAG